MNFQNIIKTLQDYWEDYGCTTLHPYTSEVGAATLHPATSITAISNTSAKLSYIQPVIRPSDGRYGKNPNRLYQHHQYQVIIKPSCSTLQNDYLKSLEKIGISTKKYDIKFIEDDWENPSIGAWGLGWEVSCNGMEITQFTYMQQIGGIECSLISGEIAYGLERIAMIVQNIDNVYDITWNDSGITYGQIFKQREYEFSCLSLDYYNIDFLFEQFKKNEEMCVFLIEKNLPLAAYDLCIKTSHILNLLDSRGVIGVNERAAYILRVRKLASLCCNLYNKMNSGKN
ncbi:glycine--tRNA ligase subunit alpha [Candidatus Neoehrlichia procyonis]|uniref:Glycine--tRNA ligase alpha subunit n=1 Tax=Candidatus Neoehrlichia procyonis str. RAC413 TaxID=1359163 RepID=A0A0F3NR46_9RICK|nr:glycine--tRNA ligase subunit alpha [Candidatus Neoehrlichia lotoris]KJV69379.1 glycine--tRNA ligase, alpha subunit [Candidatus Neoehrlichia lotoris str. RAC413]